MNSITYVKTFGRPAHTFTLARDLFSDKLVGVASEWIVNPTEGTFITDPTVLAAVQTILDQGHEEVQWPPRNLNSLSNPLGFEY